MSSRVKAVAAVSRKHSPSANRNSQVLAMERRHNHTFAPGNSHHFPMSDSCDPKIVIL